MDTFVGAIIALVIVFVILAVATHVVMLIKSKKAYKDAEFQLAVERSHVEQIKAIMENRSEENPFGWLDSLSTRWGEFMVTCETWSIMSLAKGRDICKTSEELVECVRRFNETISDTIDRRNQTAKFILFDEELEIDTSGNDNIRRLTSKNKNDSEVYSILGVVCYKNFIKRSPTNVY